MKVLKRGPKRTDGHWTGQELEQGVAWSSLLRMIYVGVISGFVASFATDWLPAPMNYSLVGFASCCLTLS